MQLDRPEGDEPDEATGPTSRPLGAGPDASGGPDDATLVGGVTPDLPADATLVGAGAAMGADGAAPLAGPDAAGGAEGDGPGSVEAGAAVGSAALAEIVRAAGRVPAAVSAVPSGAPDAHAGQVQDLPNEAIPAVPPEPGTEAIGSIPAARARWAWARVQASNWRLFLIRFLSAGIAVVLTVAVLPELGFRGWEWGTFTQIGVVFGLLNATVKPLLQFLVLRFIFSTYGIVVVVINALLLVLLATVLEGTFVAYRPISIVVGGAVVGALGLVLETLLGATPPVLDRDYRERNGLK